MKCLYQLLLAFNSTFLIIIVYLVKENYVFNCLSSYSFLNNYMLAELISWSIFLLLPIGFTALSFFIAKKLPVTNLNNHEIIEIELANNSFLPTYLGYFFVSLGVEDMSTLIFVFLVIYVFTFLSQSLYFNPIFLLFGYQFYFIRTINNVKIFLITKSPLRVPGEDGFDSLYRINNYTFIDL